MLLLKEMNIKIILQFQTYNYLKNVIKKKQKKLEN